jgi:hypothetical protein
MAECHARLDVKTRAVGPTMRDRIDHARDSRPVGEARRVAEPEASYATHG